MKIGIIVGDSSGLSSQTNLESFILYDKFAVDLISRFPNNCEVELQIIKRIGIKALSDKINGKGFDFIVSLSCSSKHLSSFTPQVLYLRDSSKGYKLAQQFSKSLKRFPDFKDVLIQFRNESDIEGYPLAHMEVPCIIAKPFQGNNLQDTLKDYDSLVSVYIQAIQNSMKLI